MKILALVLVSLFYATPSFAFFFPPVEHCAYTDSDEHPVWFGNQKDHCGSHFKSGSNVAFEFKVEDPTTIYSLEGWIWTQEHSIFEPTLTYSINLKVYEGTEINEHRGHVPVLSSLFEERFYFTDNPNLDWRGPENMDLFLEPGTYWAAFEDGSAGMPATFPNAVTAFVGGKDGFPLRLSTTTAAVPEPSSILLMLSGLGWMVRRKWER